jgi:hypothetical protein
MSKPANNEWDRLVVFLGLDWAKDHHDVVAVDGDGALILKMRIEDSAEGWQSLGEKLAECAGPREVSMARRSSAFCS